MKLPVNFRLKTSTRRRSQRRKALGTDEKGDPMKPMTSGEIHRAIRKALNQVSLRLAAGELDHSGRYYPEPELPRRRVVPKSRRKADTHTRLRDARRKSDSA